MINIVVLHTIVITLTITQLPIITFKLHFFFFHFVNYAWLIIMFTNEMLPLYEDFVAVLF